MPGNDNLLKVVGDLLLSSEEKIRTSRKKIFFSRHEEGGLCYVGHSESWCEKKEGEEIIECSDILEQSKAKTNRNKASWIQIMQDYQKHKGADPECLSPTCQKISPHLVQPMLCPYARPAWRHTWILKEWIAEQQKSCALPAGPGCAGLWQLKRTWNFMLCLVTGPNAAATVRATWLNQKTSLFSF